MMPVWYLKMNQRERILALIVASALFLLVNFFIWKSLFGAITNARAEVAERKSNTAQQNVYLKESALWAVRDSWLKQHQPPLKGPAEASALLEEVKQIAGKHNILIENPALGTGEAAASYQAVFASFETKSQWPPLLQFLYSVQQPESFVAFETVSLAIDNTDKTMMRGKFKVARWFAPKK